MSWTRRTFLNSTAQASTVLISQIKPVADARPVLDQDTQLMLRVAMDEIIPRQGEMPSASEANGMAYFAALMKAEPEAARSIEVALKSLRTASRAISSVSFHKLDSEQRIAALTRFETSDTANFTVLRNFIYEAYYTQPVVGKLIGYEFYPTDHRGPHMKPFDEAILAKVRSKPKFYRET